MSSLTFYLQMHQVCEKFNLLVDGVKQKVPGSPVFHSEVANLHGQIEHLREGIKAWNRLLSLGSVPRVPTASLMELQRERSRIFHKIQLLEAELDKVGLHNTFSTLSNHGTGGLQMRSPGPADSWNAYHPHPVGLGTSGSAVMPVAPNATPPNYPNELRVLTPGESVSGWCSCSSNSTTESEYLNYNNVFSSSCSTLSSAASSIRSNKSNPGVNGKQ